MTSPRRLVVLVSILLIGTASAQERTAPPVSGADERAARVVERYKSMLQANPVEGLALDRLWKSSAERGETPALLEEYRRLTEAPIAGPSAWLIYGHLLQRAGRLDEADACYDRASLLDPASPLPPLARADLATANSQPEKATQFLTSALTKLPAGDRRQTETLLKLGTAWMAAGQPLQAADAWEKMIARDPADLALRRQLAETYEKNGLPDRALAHFQYLEAHAEPAERASALRDLARLHEARGEFEAARDALERGLALTARDNWQHGELENRLIRLYQRAGRLPELEARWRSAAEAAPRDLGAWLRLVSLAQAEGDPTAERRWLEKVVALAPREREYSLRLARRLADDGACAPAAELYDQLLKVQPDNLDLTLARADLDLQLGHPAAAAERIEALVNRRPGDESVATSALGFFLEHHLDVAAEKSLRADVARHPATADPALALAKFLFAQRKPTEARAALDALTAAPGDPTVRAARWLQAAAVYGEQHLTPDALHAWRQAAALQPAAPAASLAAGEYLLARGDRPAAAAEFEHAAALTTGQEEIDAERKWFEALEDADHPLPDHVAALERTAATAPTSDNFLRLARWQSWAHRPEAALASAARAIEADPANLAARHLTVSLATDLHLPAQAEGALSELIARDPEHRHAYEREQANLKLDAGDPDGAVAIFTRLQQSEPGSREALTDLALAQQRADRWSDALATWERAYALPGGTPAQQEEIRRPLLAAYERLGQFPRAAEVLGSAVDAQTDLAAKTDLFRELASFCRRHELGARLREDYERRLAAHPDDYFLLTALAELRREDGQERAAYALLQRANYSSPDPARALRELADQAAQLGEDAEAAGYQRRLISLPNQASAANLEKLAAFEDADLEDAAAAHTWESIVGRFPRDTAVLSEAAEYFEKADQPGRARELLRQLIEVDGTAIPRLLALASLDVQAGDTAAARDHYERVLAGTGAEAADEALTVPADLASTSEGSPFFATGRGSLTLRRLRLERSATSSGAVSEERQWRLQAIEALARLLFPPGSPNAGLDSAQTAWLQRWRASAAGGARSEPLAAFYYAGQRDPTMELLGRWMENPDASVETAAGAFLQAGLRLHGYAQMAKWAWRGGSNAEVAGRGQRLLGALQSFLGASGKPGPDMVDQLFPPDLKVREVLWTAAQNAFAANHWYGQAAELGERVFNLAPATRASYGVEVAEWETYAGHPERARDVLRRSLDEEDGVSFEAGNPVFTALRAYYLLLPEGDRPAFVAQYLGRPPGRGGAAHAVLSAALLHGLAGDYPAAGRDLDQLLAMRMLSIEPASLSPDLRRWGYLLANGEQLQAWNLDPLAVHLWTRALREAGAFDRQASDVDGTVSEMRRRLLAAETAIAPDPLEGRRALGHFLGEEAEPSALAGAATQLWADGQHPAAARLYEILCQNDPAIGDYWPNLFSFYETTGNDDGAERLLTLMLTPARALPAGTNRAELTCSLALLREKRGDAPGACRLLERARQSMSGALPILCQLAETYERVNRWNEAGAIWHDTIALDQTHTARLGLAGVLERAGRRGEAADVLRGRLKDGPDPGRTELAVRLTQILLADHQADQARLFASDLIDKGQFEPLPAVAAAFTAAGQAATAREFLAAAVLRAHEPTPRFYLQQALAEQFADPGSDQAVFIRQMRRLQRMAQSSESLREAYDDLLIPLAHRQGADAWVEDELRRRWAGGAGEPTVGVQLAALALQNHREDLLREVVQTINHRPDLPERLLGTLATSLIKRDHAPLALALCERLAKRFPQKQEYALQRARCLWKSDLQAEAHRVLEDLAASAVFRDGVLEAVAGVYLELGEKARALGYLERIVQHDPLAIRSPQSFLQLAQLFLDDKRIPEAGRLLEIAYARPACDDLSPLVRYLQARGDLASERSLAMPGADFPLTFTRRARLLAAVRDRLESDGRAEDGWRLLGAHPEFLGAIPNVAAAWTQRATPDNVPAIAGALERALDEHSPPSPALMHALAGLYAQWAIWDSNLPGTRDDALAHLSRAVALEPDNFAFALPLAKLCLQQQKPDRAREVLAAFLTPEALPAERAEAARVLAR